MKKTGRPNRSKKSSEVETGTYSKSNRFKGKHEQGGMRDKSSNNDFSWYNQNPDLVASAASLPFPYRPGMFLKELASSSAFDGYAYSIPGVMKLDFIPQFVADPTADVIATTVSPYSIAAKEIYARVRAAYSGTLVADPPDFVIYMMALDSIFMYLSHLKRIYRTINAYDPNNRLTPNAFLAAMGIPVANIPQWEESKTQLWGMINELIYMTQKFTCPAIYPLFNRHYWMTDNVFADAPTLNSQMYILNLVGVYQFALQTFYPIGSTESVQVGGLTMQPVTMSTPTAAFNFGKTLINALAESDDAYTISGYLARAYDGVPTFAVQPLSQDEVLTPQYNPEVLPQIENLVSLRICTNAYDLTTLRVSQNPRVNAVTTTNTLSANAVNVALVPSGGPAKIEPMLSIRSDTPTLQDIVEASRLMATSYVLKAPSATEKSVIQIRDCGTEVVLSIQHLVNNPVNPGELASTYINQFSSASEIKTTVIADLTSFDWSPRILLADMVDKKYHLVWDVHNVTTFSESQLKEIHRVCVYSELNTFNSR